MFCYSMKDKLKTICYVFHMIWIHVWLPLFHYSWSFVCISFYVITWVLSFYCQDYVFYAHVLCSLIPALNALHRWSRLWWCMSPQKLFFCYTWNILEIGRNKSRTFYFYRSFVKTEDETKGGQEPGSPQGGAAQPLAVLPPPDAALSPIKSPRREKPKGWIAFPWNILQAAAIIVTRSGGSRSSSRHPIEGLLHHHGRLRSDVWVFYLGLLVHSSS
jgi:hypothetical protein